MGKSLVIVMVVAAFLFGIVAGYLIAIEHVSPRVVPDREARGRRPDMVEGASTVDKKMNLAELTDRLDAMEKTMDRFYRGDPVEKAKSTINRIVDKHNKWVDTMNAQHQAQGATLEKRLDKVRRFRERVEGLDKRLDASRPDPTDKSGVESYNALVSLRNSLFTEGGELGKLCEADAKTLKDAVELSKQEQAARKKRVEAAKEDTLKEIEVYRRWRKADRGPGFAMSVNRLYAELHRERRRIGPSAEFDACIDRARTVRHDLGVHVAGRHARGSSKLIVVPAMLSRREECFLIVDTGATCVAVSPTMVEALGLSDSVGDEIEVSLAGGVTIKARELLLPQLSVFGQETSDVRAVVLKESEVGIDGLLGLSFLNRFNYRIDRTKDPKLILAPRSE